MVGGSFLYHHSLYLSFSNLAYLEHRYFLNIDTFVLHKQWYTNYKLNSRKKY